MHDTIFALSLFPIPPDIYDRIDSELEEDITTTLRYKYGIDYIDFSCIRTQDALPFFRDTLGLKCRELHSPYDDFLEPQFEFVYEESKFREYFNRIIAEIKTGKNENGNIDAFDTCRRYTLLPRKQNPPVLIINEDYWVWIASNLAEFMFDTWESPKDGQTIYAVAFDCHH